MYVDVSAASVDSVEGGNPFVNVSKENMEKGGLKLRKWDTDGTERFYNEISKMGQDDCITYMKKETW